MTPDSERCLLTATPACRSRAGITKISEGYVAVLSNRVGVDCRDCRDLGLNGNRQRVVKTSEVKKFIEEGWEYLSDLPSGEAIVRLGRAREVLQAQQDLWT